MKNKPLRPICLACRRVCLHADAGDIIRDVGNRPLTFCDAFCASKWMGNPAQA